MFEIHKSDFTVEHIPDLSGKVVIITGGTAGLGLVSAVELANKGAHVIITARNSGKGEAAINAIKKALEKKNGKASEAQIEFGVAELEDLHSINAFASWFLAKNLALHIFLLSAGVCFVPFR